MATTLQVPFTVGNFTDRCCLQAQTFRSLVWHVAHLLLCCWQALSAEGHFKSQELQQLAQMAAQRLGAATSQPSLQTK